MGNLGLRARSGSGNKLVGLDGGTTSTVYICMSIMPFSNALSNLLPVLAYAIAGYSNRNSIDEYGRKEVMEKNILRELAPLHSCPRLFALPATHFIHFMSSFCNGIPRMPFFLIPRMFISYVSFRVPEYCEKYVKPEDVVGAEEVKSSDGKLSTYYALHARYENCLVLYMMFSSRKIQTRQNWGTCGKIPTYPFLSLLSMDVCTLRSNYPISSYSLCACFNYTTVYYALLVFIYTLVDLTLVMTWLAANGIYISHVSNTLWWNPFCMAFDLVYNFLFG
ncbi:hypothetical protein CXB51_009111 [Gossypium anomalum]|uniref:Uncharacterized protein n=1 Tax=Gossypium anomalum TaxID=47600 RepID=A0A8J5YZ05_9ROSI|nr:hypothetical protein CXB51_009111 [Gossypium anomalum]